MQAGGKHHSGCPLDRGSGHLPMLGPSSLAPLGRCVVQGQSRPEKPVLGRVASGAEHPMTEASTVGEW